MLYPRDSFSHYLREKPDTQRVQRVKTNSSHDSVFEYAIAWKCLGMLHLHPVHPAVTRTYAIPVCHIRRGILGMLGDAKG